MNVQTRIQQVFSVSAVIVGILAAFLSSQDDAKAIDAILGAVVAVIFLRIAWLYQESQRTRPWKVPDAASISKKMDTKSVAWLGRQMIYRYDENAKAQDQVASILNASTWTMMVMVFVAVLYLVVGPLLFAATPRPIAARAGPVGTIRCIPLYFQCRTEERFLDALEDVFAKRNGQFPRSRFGLMEWDSEVSWSPRCPGSGPREVRPSTSRGCRRGHARQGAVERPCILGSPGCL